MESIQNGSATAIHDQRLSLEEFVHQQYCAKPDISVSDARYETQRAFERARAKHLDLAEFPDEMSSVACCLLPIWRNLTLDRYIELLYCVAKHPELFAQARFHKSQDRERVQ